MIYIFTTKIRDEMYRLFLEYAYETCDSFMLVYFRYKNRKYPKTMTDIRTALKKYKLMSRTNLKTKEDMKWPGTETTDHNNHYTATFYVLN